MKALAVSELNAQIKSILEQTFMDILVCGEISSVKIHTSGHIYLTLKDEHSSIRCVMFKGNARSLKMTLEVGQNVEINGAISVYSPKGEYQILCKSIALAGIGELSRAFEALKTKLSAKGYFDSAHKKPLPRFPKRIALLTSATGAAKEDMLKVAQKRWENIHITLFNTIVQGVEAKDSIVRNIALADSFFGTKEGFDVLIIGRGGGSMEDMWAFNEECVAEAIFAARTPIVSAVGHEIDTFISDFVADIRAPTPSAAMEILLPDKNEYLRLLDEMMNAFASILQKHITHKSDILEQLKEYFRLFNFQSQYMSKTEQIKTLQTMLTRQIEVLLQEKKAQCENMALSLNTLKERYIRAAQSQYERIYEAISVLNPTLLCARGFAQVSKDNMPIVLEQLKQGDTFYLSDIKHSILAQCIERKTH